MPWSVCSVEHVSESSIVESPRQQANTPARYDFQCEQKVESGRGCLFCGLVSKKQDKDPNIVKIIEKHRRHRKVNKKAKQVVDCACVHL